MTQRLRYAVDECIERAQKSTGLTDWGGATFRAELESLADDVERSGPNSFGRSEFLQRVQKTLINRLSIVEDRILYPEISVQTIIAPIVVVGLPRSGTTFLQALLAQDPASRSVAEWEGSRPSPPPQEATYHSDPRIAQARAEMPSDSGWQEKHIHDAELPIECGPAFFNYEFLSMGYDCRWRVPQYRQRMTQPIPRAYEWHLRCLQHLQSQMKRDRWVLKSPEHLAHFQELFTTYPDARILFTHRDPIPVLASLASMVSYMRRPHYDASVADSDARVTGGDGLEYWGSALQTALDFRAETSRESQICDVTYQELTTDPMAVVRRIYHHFNLPLPAENEAAMEAWLVDNHGEKRQELHGAHRYTLESYGLDADVLRERFGGYIRQFDL